MILDNVALLYTDKGSSKIAQQGESGAISGILNKGQTLIEESTCGENLVTTDPERLVNSGKLILTHAEGCGNNGRSTWRLFMPIDGRPACFSWLFGTLCSHTDGPGILRFVARQARERRCSAHARTQARVARAEPR